MAGGRASIEAALAAAILLASIASAQPLRPNMSSITRSTERPLPTGQSITPLAARGASYVALNPELPGLPDFTAGQPAAMALSPDQRTLLVLTSGYNRQYDTAGKIVPAGSNEYIFVFDVTGATPVKLQVLQLPNSFLGIGWSPRGDAFYVSGGVDDVVREYTRAASGFAAARTFALGHKAGLGLAVKPGSAGLAVSPDGTRLLVANLQNDSVSLIDLASGGVTERDLRPGVGDPAKSGQPGGTFPRAVVWVSDTRAYVTSERDREVIALNVGPAATASELTIGARIATRGQPTALLTNAARTRLYAAQSNSDAVVVVDPARDRVLGSFATTAPAAIWPNPARLGGAGSNALALSPDGRTLFVSNGGENAVAVVALGNLAAGVAAKHGAAASSVVGLIPTGWYPTAVAVTKSGQLFVTNNKSQPGPNPGGCRQTADALDDDRSCQAANQYVWQLEKGGLLSLPVPSGAELGRLTRQVAVNDHFPGYEQVQRDAATMAFLRAHIRHVVYIVKENRTYDQVLGDLGIGNGDPKLTLLGAAITPNHHALARQFVTLDAFFDSGESSNTGWNWTTAGRTTDFTERAAPVNYAGRGLQYDQEGNNRNINVSFADIAERHAANPLTPADPNLLAGGADVAAPDGPGGDAGHGYLWDNALRAGKTVRNYGFYGDLSRYFVPAATGQLIPLERDPFSAKLQVFYTTKAALRPLTDYYFRGFDQSFPDFYRFKEWEREFDAAAASGTLPQLTLLRLAHDHFGNFKTAIDGVDTIETMMADNDYALGRVIEKIAHSSSAADTLVFVIEDDAQNGADHVDAHRSMAFIVGPYVKQHAVVSTHHTTVDFVRTIEDILGLPPMGLNDALAQPMSDVFDTVQTDWNYTALVPNVLRSTRLPLPAATNAEHVAQPRRTAAWWAAAMAGQNFAEEDRLDTAAFNRALWRGLKGEPLPKQLAAAPAGRDAD